MKKIIILSATAISMGLAAVSFSATADSHSDSSDAVAARKAAMKNVGATMKASGQMMGSGTFDANLAAALGRTLQSSSAGLSYLFPEGSFDGKTTAANTIPGDAKFKQLAMTLENAGVAMASATDTASFGAAMQQAGGTCRACHTAYRTK